ncbi:unnamed protein product, partial [Ilex paraguariensis]
MALYLSKSKIVLCHLKSKMGALSTINQSSCSSYTIHHLTSPPPVAQNLINPNSVSSKNSNLSAFRRYESIKAEKKLDSMQNVVDDTQVLSYPGGMVKFIPYLRFISQSLEERIHCYQVLDDSGRQIFSSNSIEVGEDIAVKMYTDMATLQVMDTAFYEAQRQGRISFYVTTTGEEAINIASAAALSLDDLVFPQ